MKRVLVLVLILAIVAVPVAYVAAQDPGSGGLIIEGSTRSSADIRSMVPMQCSGVECRNPTLLLFPELIGVDAETQNWAPNVRGDMAIGWEVSEDGLTYTVFMRDDMVWSDGTPITAADAVFFWEAAQNGEEVELSSSYGPMSSALTSATVVDDHTVQFTLETPSCEGLRRVADIQMMPSHAYGWEPGMEDFDWSSVATSDFRLNPTVTSGPFTFNRIEPGTAIYLEANQDYPDAEFGGVIPEGWVFLDVPDDNILAERYIAHLEGDINSVREPQGVSTQILDAYPDTTLDAPGRVWHYVAINLADPNAPANGLDDAGNPVDQGHHPLFGDVRIRQALQAAMDINEIVNGPLNGNATPMVVGTIPTAFTIHPTLERRPLDLDAARALLDEAGFPASGDPLVDGGDGLRVATADALYAEEGTPFSFEIMNVGDVRGDVAVVLQNQFAKIGVEVEVSVLDFNAMYDDNMGQQTYDAAVAGWRGDLPFNPDQRNFFGAEQDIAGDQYGFNFTSWYNAEFEELNQQIETLPGCDPDERAALAHRAQEIMYDEQPYLWLYAINSLYSAWPEVDNWDPRPNYPDWNADSLLLAQ
jgi:peptide/nickel transport system substrate-binding protein